MSNTNLRYLDMIKCISQTGQEFIEVNDDFCLRFPNPFFDKAHTLQIGRYFQQIIPYASQDIVPFVGSRWQEIRTLKPTDRSLNASHKEVRQLTGLAFSNQNFHHFMPVLA